jgi:hypothetical protein
LILDTSGRESEHAVELLQRLERVPTDRLERPPRPLLTGHANRRGALRQPIGVEDPDHRLAPIHGFPSSIDGIDEPLSQPVGQKHQNRAVEAHGRRISDHVDRDAAGELGDRVQRRENPVGRCPVRPNARPVRDMGRAFLARPQHHPGLRARRPRTNELTGPDPGPPTLRLRVAGLQRRDLQNPPRLGADIGNPPLDVTVRPLVTLPPRDWPPHGKHRLVVDEPRGQALPAASSGGCPRRRLGKLARVRPRTLGDGR